MRIFPIEERKERNEKIVYLYVNHPEMTLKEIGRLFGIGPSRVGEITKEAGVGGMRKKLKEKEEDDEFYGDF